jgi:hypothetical protein
MASRVPSKSRTVSRRRSAGDPLPDFVELELAMPVERPLATAEWLHE